MVTNFHDILPPEAHIVSWNHEGSNNFYNMKIILTLPVGFPHGDAKVIRTEYYLIAETVLMAFEKHGVSMWRQPRIEIGGGSHVEAKMEVSFFMS